MNTPVLFFKALGAQKFKNQPGYYLHEGHWHAIGADGHVPKGAPQAHHPEAAGYHAPAAHFSPDEWASLKLPDTNVNAPAYNKGLEKLKEWSDAGNVTAIVGAGYGTNTYGKKLAIIANKLLAMHGSEHKVVAGQKAGEHAVAAGPAQSAAPAPAPAPIEPAAAALPDLDTPEDMAANHTHGTIPMPEFQEGKNISGVKEYYEGVAQKIIDQAHASNVANLEAMKESGLKPNSKGKVSNTWAGKTANSKILLALHAQALEHAKGAPAPAPVEAANPPAAVPAGWEGSAKGVITKPGDSGGMVDENAAGKGWFVIANNDAANEAMSGKFFPTQAAAVAALDAALAPAPAAHKPHTQHALPDLDGVISKKPQGLGAMNGGAVADTIASHYKAGDLKALQSIKENLFTPTAVGPALYDGKAKKAMGEFLDAAIAKLSPVAESVALADFKTDAMAPTLSKKAFTGSNQVWHSQQKLGDVVFAAGSTMMGQGANDHTKKMAAQIKAAQAAGYKVGYYKTAGLQAVYVFEKDGQLLTKHGAAKLAESAKTTSSLPPHLSKLAEKLDGKPVPGATVTDVTPAGYGPEPESGPKEGDTKPGANGTTLVLKDGHWVTQGDKALALSDAEMPDYPENLPALQMVYCSKAGKAADAGDLQGVKDALSSLGHTEGKAFNYITSLITKMEAKAAGAPATAATPTEAVAKGDDLTPPKITTGSGHTSAWSETVESAYVAYSNGDWSALAEFAQEAAGALTEPGKIAQAYIAKLQAKAPKPAPTATPGALTPTQLGNLQSIPWFKQKLPDTNTNAKSHNAAVAKIEAMAFAGDAAGLSAFASSKENAKQTYAKKQYLLAVTAMAALQEGGAAAPAAPAAPAKPAPAPTTADTPLTAEQLGALGKLSDAELAAIDGAPGLGANVHAWVKNKLASTGTQKGQAPTGTEVKTISGVTAFKTEGGSWQLKDSDTKAAIANTNSSASKELTAGYAPHADWFAGKGATDGNKEVVAEIALQAGADPQHVLGTLYPGAPVGTVKEDLDFGNSYELTNSGWKKVVAAGDNGPKEGDTKMGADGMLVLKNGHWVKMEPDAPAAPKAKKLTPSQAIQVMKAVPGTASGMKAKLKALAVAGDVPGLEKFIADHPKLAMSKIAAKKLIEAMTDGTPETPQSPKKKSAPQAPKVAVPTSFVPTTPGAPASMDHWQQVGPQGGSNPGGKFRDHLGQDWYCKFPADEDIAKSEVLAAKLYELSGITGQDAKLITKDGKVGIASKWTTVSKADSPSALSAVEGVHQGFMVDAWLGNWDVVGLGYDNLQIGADGKAVRVDAGGSLEYRAQGAKKPFGTKVDEIDTLRNAAINPQSAAVFGSMTDADIAASAAKVAAVDDEHIRVLVGLYGPGTDAEKKALADTLIARKADIIARYPNAAPKKKPPAAPVYRIPEAPDFENWNGAGKGLSSKPAFNKQNQELAQKINELGNAGDVDAVKNMTYQPINEAGAPVGDEKLVLNHSSTHIPNYLKDVIFAMTTPYVSPKLMFRDAIKNMSGAFKAMSLMFPGFSALKEAAQSVGRYAVLGVAKAGNPIQGWKPKLTSKKQGTIDVQTLYNQSVANFKNLSATERQSIKDYTGHHYGNMNSALLLGTNHDMAYTAITAMKKASVPLPPGAILGRRFQFNKALDGTDNNENHEKAMAELLAHGEGAVLQEFGLISTSTNSMFWGGKVHLKITVGEGVKGLYVDHNPATHSGAISSSPNENEIMLPYGTRFLVTKIHPKGHKFSDETGEWGMKYGDEQVIEVTVLPNL